MNATIARCVGLLVIVSGSLRAQTAADQSRGLQRAALAAFAESYGKRTELQHGGRRLVLDPAVASSRYSVAYALMEDAAPSTLADADELAGVMHGSTAAPSELRRCTGAGLDKRCVYSPVDLIVVQVGDPVVSGERATVTIRLLYSVPGVKGDPLPDAETLIVTLARVGGVWKSNRVDPVCSVTRCRGAG